ncbi:S-layer homology domain-containing protein [Syntrophomonas erecta]
MTRKLVAITISMLLVLSMLPGIALGNSVTLTLSTDSAKAGTNIMASGSADPDVWVSIKVLDSTQNIVFFDAVKSNTSGDYSCKFIVPAVSPGTLTVVAGYGTNVDTKPLVISDGGGVTPVTLERIAITKLPQKLIYTVGETLDLTGLEVTGTYSNGSSRVEKITKSNVSGFDSSRAAARQVLTITVDGRNTSYDVTITKLETATKNETIAITPDTPVTINVPANASGAKIKVNQDEALPLVAVKATTSLGTVEMAIPEGNKVLSSPANWDGAITLPIVKIEPSASVSGAQKVNAVIEVGLSDEEITFEKPVRLLIPGQKGQSAGYIRNGKFTAITTLIPEDNQAAAEKALKNAKDGKVDVGRDLAIWTKHFTEFVAYTPSSSSGSKGGGGGSVTPAGQTITTNGGTVKEAGAVVSFPADAVSSDIKVTVKKLSTGIPAVSTGFKLLGDVYEISSDKNINFKKPVTITLPYNRNKADNGKYEVGIYVWDNSKWVILDQVKVDTTAAKVSGEVSHFSKFAVLGSEKTSPVTPVDDEKDKVTPVTSLKDTTGHWAEANISKLVALGAVSGYPDGSFKPDNTISRAEFATILVKAFNLQPKEGKVFSDTANHWAKDYITTAAGYGIVGGYDADNFGPNDNITREQMAVMIDKAAKLANTAPGKSFADGAQISDWAKEAVGRASGKGIISGYPDNTFKPKATATRAEAVTVVVNALAQ